MPGSGLGSPFRTPKRKRITQQDFVSSPLTPPSTKRPKVQTPLRPPRPSPRQKLPQPPAPSISAQPRPPSSYPPTVKPAPSALPPRVPVLDTRPARVSKALLPPPLDLPPRQATLLSEPRGLRPLLPPPPALPPPLHSKPDDFESATAASNRRWTKHPPFTTSWVHLPSTTATTPTLPQAQYSDLPIEILQAVHIYSGSDALPFVNKRTRQALSGVSYLARWSLYNYTVNGVKSRASETVLDGLLKRRFCTIEVVERVLELWDLSFGLKRSFAASDVPSTPERPPVPPLMVRHIPRRLLRTTAATQPRIHPMIPWLVDKFGFSVDADSSFALKRAALDQNYELAEWLLARGANVRKNGMLSFKAAIMTKDLRMLKLLIEPGYQVDADGKQVLDEHGVPVKEADRVDAPQEWVDLALQHGARDIVLWLVEKKSLTPSLDKLMQLGGFDEETVFRMTNRPSSRRPPVEAEPSA